MQLKQQAHSELLFILNKKIIELTAILNETIEATSSDSKSSAGDKHETSVAMAQLEQEKLSKQLNELLTQKNLLKSINPEVKHVKIGLGSLVETDNGWFYFSIGLGSIKIKNISFFALNPTAPLGLLMLGKEENENIIFQNKSFRIKTIL